MDKRKLEKFAANLVTDRREIEEIVTWIEASPEHQKEFSRIKNQDIYESFRNFETLTKEIRKAPPSPSSMNGKTIRLQFLRYAAVFILAFILGGSPLFLFRDRMDREAVSFNEIIVPAGQSSEIILADQTHVWLNSGARLSYPSNFNGDTREVKLTGEAFFDVTKDGKRPFHVVTPNLTVNVLGTTFNVEAIDQSNLTNVTLVEGKVKLEDQKGNLLAVLAPNENALYDTRKGKVELTKVNTGLYTSWKEGIIFFRDEKLSDISEKLERWYNVKIIFDDEAARELKFTGAVLRNKPVDQIMEILKFTSGIAYSINVRDNKPNLIHLKKIHMSE
ncbi:MAG: FecR family protein [Mangrovibacterium sp.]